MRLSSFQEYTLYIYIYIYKGSWQFCYTDAPHERWLSIWRKIWRQLYKNATSYIEQVLEVAYYKTTTVRPPTTHLENHPN